MRGSGYRQAWFCAAALLLTPMAAKAQSVQPSPAAPSAPSARSDAAPSAPAAPRRALPSSPTAAARQPVARWLPWTLLGLGAASTASTIVAFSQRERHATRWNGAACLQPGVTRGSVCPDERDAIRTWDTVLVLSGVSAGLFFGGALLSRKLQEAPTRSGASDERAGLSDCGLSWGRVSCRGRF